MDKYFKAVYGELPFEELDSIRERDIPKGDYYDYEKIRMVLLRKKEGKIADEYFHRWLTILAWALNNEEYRDISWAFDGYSFQLSFDSRLVLEIMARLKDFDYKLRYDNFIEQQKNEKLQVIYLRFEHCNWTEDSAVFKAYFVDYKNRRFDIRLIDDAFFTYDDAILYCFIGANEEIDEENEEIVEPRETREESQLMQYFYNENVKWTYDHNLSF